MIHNLFCHWIGVTFLATGLIITTLSFSQVHAETSDSTLNTRHFQMLNALNHKQAAATQQQKKAKSTHTPSVKINPVTPSGNEDIYIGTKEPVGDNMEHFIIPKQGQ